MKKFKKVFSSVLGIIMGVSTLSFSGCGDNGFAGVNTDDEIYAALAEATEDFFEYQDSLTIKIGYIVERNGKQTDNMTFKFSINPKDNVMYYILDSEDTNVKVKLFKESGTSYVMTSVKAETNDNGATVTYENDEYRQISETNANFLTSVGSFIVLSERDLNSIFRDYMYSFTETKNAYESVYAEQVEERRKTDDKADAEYDISTKKTSGSISMEEYSKIVKTDKGEYGNGTYTIIQRSKVTGKKGRISQEKLEAEISFLGSNAAAVAMNKKITLQTDIDYSFDKKTYKGIKTDLPTYVPTYSYSEDYKMNFNVGGMVTEKTSTAVSYNPNTIFNSLTKDFTPNGCIVDWYYDSAYTKPFALQSPTYDEFHEIKYLYGRLTISNDYAIIARDYKIRDNRTDAYKAVFGPILEGGKYYEICASKLVKDTPTYSLPIMGEDYESFVNGEKYDDTSNVLNLDGGRFYLVEHIETITNDGYSIFDIDVSMLDVW